MPVTARPRQPSCAEPWSAPGLVDPRADQRRSRRTRAVRPMTDPAALVRREVTPEEWVETVTRARDAAYDFFDWLTAVDQTDDAEAPGFDVVCHLLDGSVPTALRRIMIRTRVPE